MGFADRMKVLKAAVCDSVRERSAAVGEVREATRGLLDEARSYLADVVRQHHARADEVRGCLETSRNHRREEVKQLKAAIHEGLDQMRKSMRAALDETNSARHKHVSALLGSFQETRAALASDLEEAGRLWRGRTAC